MKLQARLTGFLEKIDNRQRYYIFAGLLMFIFLMDYVILMRPQLSSLSKITPEIQILRDDLRLAKENIERTDDYRVRLATLKEDVTQINASLQSRDQFPVIMEWISRAADESGVTIDQVMPMTADQRELLSVQRRKYLSFPLNIQARGGYHQFGVFLNRLESGDIFLSVESFSIVSSEGRTPHKMELSLWAVVYE
jgi:type IV pilus assembly protein PilO